MEINTQMLLTRDDKERLKAILSVFLFTNPANIKDKIFAEALLTKLIDS